MNDVLSYEGHSLSTPREIIRQGLVSGYLSEEDCEVFLDAIDKRNFFSHAYDEEVALKAEAIIKNQFYPMFARLHKTFEEKRIS